MKLVDLNPRWMGAGGEGVFSRGPNGELVPAPKRHGVGVIMDCPCGNKDEGHQLYVPFANPLDGGGPFDERGWQRVGDTFETLTLSPSVLRDKAKGGCGWHGWFRNGEVIAC